MYALCIGAAAARLAADHQLPRPLLLSRRAHEDSVDEPGVPAGRAGGGGGGQDGVAQGDHLDVQHRAWRAEPAADS